MANGNYTLIDRFFGIQRVAKNDEKTTKKG